MQLQHFGSGLAALGGTNRHLCALLLLPALQLVRPLLQRADVPRVAVARVQFCSTRTATRNTWQRHAIRRQGLCSTRTATRKTRQGGRQSICSAMLATDVVRQSHMVRRQGLRSTLLAQHAVSAPRLRIPVPAPAGYAHLAEEALLLLRRGGVRVAGRQHAHPRALRAHAALASRPPPIRVTG
eukprot:scaffold21317_cov112-Isochrysis_galbana.AAC.2